MFGFESDDEAEVEEIEDMDDEPKEAIEAVRKGLTHYPQKKNSVATASRISPIGLGVRSA